MVVNYKTTEFEDAVPPVDAVLDTVGGETQHRSFRVLKPGGILVSVISPPPQSQGFRSVFFLVDVTASRLGTLARLLDRASSDGARNAGWCPTQEGDNRTYDA